MIGKIVTYNGFKQHEEKGTIEAIITEMCIGYDEETIYTKFIKPKYEYYQKWPKWDEEFTLDKAPREFRVGFHKSRLIKIHAEIKININNEATQLKLW
ncbi:MAG: hypothetical protein [Microvirus sp.]|nr:MAG: hypothetical protein [Microvirus sp.]